MGKTPPPARSDFALRASQGQSHFFTYPAPFLTNDKCEAPYENTALAINEKGLMPFSKRLCPVPEGDRLRRWRL